MRAGPLLIDDLQQESRRYLASYVMFNQAVADHLELHPTDVQCLNLMTAESGPFTTGRIARRGCGISRSCGPSWVRGGVRKPRPVRSGPSGSLVCRGVYARSPGRTRVREFSAGVA